MYFIAKDHRPLGSVEDDGFLFLMATAVPHYNVPSRKTITRLMEIKFDEFKGKLKDQLQSVNSHVLTCDGWTDCKNQSYLGVTDHYLTCQMTVASAILGVYPLNERHTAEYISMKIKETLQDYEIPLSHVTAIVTDGAANMVKMVQETTGSDRHVICIAHSLAHVVPDALKSIPSLTAIIDNVRDIVKLVRRSTALTDQMKKLQQGKGNETGEARVLSLDVPTRWNSTYDMLKRFIEMKTLVAAILMESTSRLEVPRREEMDTLRDALQLMEPVKDAVVIISGEKYATGSLAIPILNCVQNSIDETFPTTVVGEQLKEALTKSVKNRFRCIEDNEVLAISTLLDPRFKKVHFKSRIKCSTAVGKINGFMKATSRNENLKPAEVQGSELVAGKSLWNFHDRLVASKVRSMDETTLSYHAELTTYLDGDLLKRDADPIEYWKTTSDVFPLLSKVALKFANVVSSSVPSERLFSGAGHVVNERRNRLTGDHVNMLVFLGSVPNGYWHLD